jgi:hypothetical protein
VVSLLSTIAKLKGINKLKQAEKSKPNMPFVLVKGHSSSLEDYTL